jgi:type IV pilus assembly protein PilX
MNATGFRRPPQRARRERGFILVTGLLFLVVMTLLGLALFRSTGLMDRITANTRDKQRSFEAAQSALEYGAWWLAQPAGGGNGTTCATNNLPTITNLHVCSETLASSLTALQDYTTWYAKAYVYNTMPGVVVATGGGMANATDINYQAWPGLYVEKLGLSTDGKTTFYQVTSYGFGGDANTVSVVRGTYKATASTSSLKNP